MPLTSYLHLRLTLLVRLGREVGAWRLAVGLPLLGLGVLQAVGTLGRHPLGCWLLPVLLAAMLLGAHRQRADAEFLVLAAPRARRWMAIEYALLSLPIGLGLLVLQAYGAALLALGLAALVAVVPPARRSSGPSQRRSWLRAEAFEWVGGLRPAGGLLWLGLLALAVWQRATPLGPVGALLGWLLVVLGCYGTPEPPTMLALAMRQPGHFLRRRLGLGLGYAVATAAPLLACLGSWRLALALGLYWLGLLALGILVKYAFYPVATHIRTTQGLVLALGLLGAAHPAFPVLLAVAAGGLVWQSRRRLRQALVS